MFLKNEKIKEVEITFCHDKRNMQTKNNGS